jgi:predicted Zn-dependent protease
VAHCQYALGQTAAARLALDQLFARHPEHAGGFLVRARLELQENKPEEAWKWLQRAETLAPHETDITYTFVLVLQRLGRLDEAQKYEHKLRDLLGQLDQLEAVKKRISQDPDSVSLRHEAGEICLRLGRDLEAARWFRSVLQLDPNHVPTHKVLAAYFHKVGDVQRGEFHRRKAEAKHELPKQLP